MGICPYFLFHQQKNMTTLGEGGMLVVNNKKFQKYIPGLRHNGHRAYPNKKKYWKPGLRWLMFKRRA